MPVHITIRNVPDATRDELAARAARQGKSMQKFLQEELQRLAERPSGSEWLERVRERKASARIRVTRAEIIGHGDAHRR